MWQPGHSLFPQASGQWEAIRRSWPSQWRSSLCLFNGSKFNAGFFKCSGKKIKHQTASGSRKCLLWRRYGGGQRAVRPGKSSSFQYRQCGGDFNYQTSKVRCGLVPVFPGPRWRWRFSLPLKGHIQLRHFQLLGMRPPSLAIPGINLFSGWLSFKLKDQSMHAGWNSLPAKSSWGFPWAAWDLAFKLHWT